MSTNQKHIVIIGGGIIGSSVAYYLTHYPHKDISSSSLFHITIVERDTPACGASGKAGGFLALDWSQPKLESLSSLSYKLHTELALKFPDIGYRKVNTLAVNATTIHLNKTKSHSKVLKTKDSVSPWLNPSLVLSSSVLGNQETTAQVHPFLLTNRLINAAQDGGAVLRIGSEVIDIELQSDHNNQSYPKGVKLDNGDFIPADIIVICTGPWTDNVSKWLPNSFRENTIFGEKAHSVTFKNISSPIPSTMLFASVKDGKSMVDLELYPRPDGEVYICAGFDSSPEPSENIPRASVIFPNEEKIDQIIDLAKKISPDIQSSTIGVRQACFVPISKDGYPLIGKLNNVENIYVAAGHSVWGILNGPATGLLIAEMIIEGKVKSADISAFTPKRLYRTLRK